MYLQDNHRVNVCLLLGLRWLDECNKALSDAQLADLQAHIQTWTQQVVEPLRALRRLLKAPLARYPQDEIQAQMRTAIKQAELLAEKKLLLEIERWSQGLTQGSSVQSALELYLSGLGVPQATMQLLHRKF